MPPVKPGFIERGGLWVVGQFALLAVALLGGMFWGGQWQSVAVGAIGWFFVAVGAVCGLCGVWALGRNLTPFPKPDAKASLVTSGIYGWICHPLYTAMGSVLLGWGLVRGSWFTVFCAPLMWGFLDRKARREEAYMIGIFPQYRDYLRRVKRFFPRVY